MRASTLKYVFKDFFNIIYSLGSSLAAISDTKPGNLGEYTKEKPDQDLLLDMGREYHPLP